jgi:hypothetical protein
MRKGLYWLYEVSGSSGGVTGYKQVLVTDEIPAGEVRGATDIVLSIIDHTIPRADRPDEPTIIRRSAAGLACIDCGGLFLPGQWDNGAVWRGGSAGQGPACRLANAQMSYRPAGGDARPTIVASCIDPATGVAVNRVYARGVGPILIVVSGTQAGQGFVRIEKLREHRVLNPPVSFPPLPTRP